MVKGRNGEGGINFFKQGDRRAAANDLAKDGAALKFRVSKMVLKHDDQLLAVPILLYENLRLLPEA